MVECLVERMLEMLLAVVGQSALFCKLVILENLTLLVYILYSYILWGGTFRDQHASIVGYFFSYVGVQCFICRGGGCDSGYGRCILQGMD